MERPFLRKLLRLVDRFRSELGHPGAPLPLRFGSGNQDRSCRAWLSVACGIGWRNRRTGRAAVAKSNWAYVGGRVGNKPPPAEKAAITAACGRLIAEALLPRFLPEIRPSTTVNYPLAIRGKWHGNKYRFLTRYHSDDPESLVAEFDAPFARLDYVSRDCFDLLWHRHTGEWRRVADGLPLADALHRIANEPYFRPC
jgi:hypothetical protein